MPGIAAIGMPVPADALQFASNAPIDPLIRALRDVGLSLESRRLRLAVIVVDAIQKTPTED